jgi:outer membrane protein assembly factor BamB
MKTQAISWMRGRAGRSAGMVAGVSGWRSRSRLLMAAAAGMALAAGVFASPAAASASTPSITLKPPSGPPTTKVSVAGAGFGASETVTVTDFGMSQSAVTSPTGTFSAAFTVPATATPGSYLVTATGKSSGLSATAKFLVRTNWAMFGFSAVNTRNNPYENVLTPSNVPNLTTAWSKSVGAVTSSPAVYNGVVYVGTAFNGLKAYNAASGTLLWTGITLNGAQIIGSSPAVANGVVYIAATDNKLYAFKAAGCGAATCQPLWTVAIGTNSNDDQSPPTVANGVIYVASGGTLDAFSTTTHALLWSAPSVSDRWAPAVANGVVYIGGGGFPAGIVAFSANGKTGCSGVPLVCAPLWTGDADTTAASSSPAVVNGVVYAGANSHLYAFSAAGCGAALCQPLWQGTLSHFVTSSPAVANGVAYIVAGGDGTFYAFSTSTHALLWTASLPVGGDNSSPAVAHGVVYVGGHGSLYAFNAAGCGAATCQPLWTAPNTGSHSETDGSVAVANGMAYIGQEDGFNPSFTAYKLPA